MNTTESSTGPNNPKLIIAAVVFPGFELLDLFGPLEMFGLLNDRVQIIIVAEALGSVPSNQGPAVIVDKTFDELDSSDIFLIPGGQGTRIQIQNHSLLNHLKIQAHKARYVATVCTGSALLAKTDILNDRKATSNKLAFSWVKQQGPHVHWIPKARWVKSGKFFTSSGISAGIDMSLAMIEQIFGKQDRLDVTCKAEYRWNSDPNDDPFAIKS